MILYLMKWQKQREIIKKNIIIWDQENLKTDHAIIFEWILVKIFRCQTLAWCYEQHSWTYDHRKTREDFQTVDIREWYHWSRKVLKRTQHGERRQILCHWLCNIVKLFQALPENLVQNCYYSINIRRQMEHRIHCLSRIMFSLHTWTF